MNQKGQNFLLKINKNDFQKNTKELEDAAKAENSSTISVVKKNNNKSKPVVIRKKNVTGIKTSKKKKESINDLTTDSIVTEHPILSGNSKYTVRLYNNLHDLLKLYKATRQGADLMETVNRFVLEGLEKEGSLKELQHLQASIKK